jgi:hypothetical protein
LRELFERTALGEDPRKRRLLLCALLRTILDVIPDQAVRILLASSIELGESWAFQELQEEGLDERTRLIRAFDRRQFGASLQQQLEAKGASLANDDRGLSLNALRAASGPISGVGDLLWSSFFRSLDALRWSLDDQRQALCAPYDATRRDHADEEWEVRVLESSRDIFGNPFRPAAFDPDWRTSTAVALARQMYDSRDFSAMPILADALQDVGCASDAILTHCRDAAGVHVRGCWVVDLVLGKS